MGSHSLLGARSITSQLSRSLARDGCREESRNSRNCGFFWRYRKTAKWLRPWSSLGVWGAVCGPCGTVVSRCWRGGSQSTSFGFLRSSSTSFCRAWHNHRCKGTRSARFRDSLFGRSWSRIGLADSGSPCGGFQCPFSRGASRLLTCWVGKLQSLGI